MKPTPKAGILDIAAYAQGKSKVGNATHVIKLSSNENALGPSPKAIEAYQREAANLHRYPDGQASQLKQAIQEVLGFDTKRLVCGAGSDEIIHFLVSAFAREGDEVLQSQHGFLMYKIYAQASGATPVFAPEKNLRTDVDALLACVTERTKIVFVANPNNPTGTYLTDAEVRRLRANLPEHVLLVMDEAYVEYVTAKDYVNASKLVDETENTVLMRTFSKAYGLPALRIGFGYMPEAIADAINRIRGPFNLSSAAIAAGVAAMHDQDYICTSVDHNTRWRSWLSGQLIASGYEVVPSEGNFLLVKCGVNGKLSAIELNNALIDKGIIVREVANYGLPDYLRITIGTENEVKAVVAAMC
jgi:histidinol-phosphate aminotransferase